MTYIVYLITREDGKRYVGTTSKKNWSNRMGSHRYHSRFKDCRWEVEILYETDDYDRCMCAEEVYISLMGTFIIGLNRSIDGKGNHLAPNFNTRGYKFSEESRAKMRESSKRRPRFSWPGHGFSDETREELSRKRTGVVFNFRFPVSVLEEIIAFHATRPPVNGAVGSVAKNGKVLSYDRLFAKTYAEKFNMTPNGIVNLLKNGIPNREQRLDKEKRLLQDFNPGRFLELRRNKEIQEERIRKSNA